MEDKTKSFFSLKQALRFYRTVRYLKFNQVYCRVCYPLKKLCYSPAPIPGRQMSAALQQPRIRFTELSGIEHSYHPENTTFTFLNRTTSFGNRIDWEFKDFGLLWSFHLHYFEWLNDTDIPVEKSLDSIRQYIDNQNKGYIFNHSFTASYRIVNWIRFCVLHEIRNEDIYTHLYRQAQRLSAFPEYELMGNHLMENGIALVWAGLFFKDERLLRRGKHILSGQLPEQVLADGAHFEKSISYHTILLKRLMELAFYYQQSTDKDKFYDELIYSCNMMLSHVFVLNGADDFLPLFGDSNEKMNISMQDLKNLAQNLLLNPCDLSLGESGIRKLEGKDFTLFFNLGNVPASYQPGHAHADAFTFCLNVKGQPVIVDPAVSTYEPGDQRMRERSTASHNTVFVEHTDSSEVWASFRMGKRVESKWLIDSCEIIDCEHNGYFSNYKIIHKRSIRCVQKKVLIEDTLMGWKGQNATIAFHFYPGLEPECNKESGRITVGNMSVEVEGAELYIEDYKYSKDFNVAIPAKRLVGIIKKETIRTTIDLNE
jgi:hypothetical protein